MAISEEQLERLSRALSDLPVDNLQDFMARIKQNSGFLAAGNNLLNRQNLSLTSNQEVLRRLNAQMEKAESQAEKQNIQEQKREVVKQTLYSNGKASLINFTNTVSSTAIDFAKGLGTALEQGTRDIMSGSSGIAVAGSFMKSMIGLTVNTVVKITDIIGEAGKSLMSIGPIAGAVGLGLQGISKAVGLAVTVMGQLSNIIIDITIKAIEDVTRSFMSAAKSGAVFGGGMTEISRLANQAGLSISSFSRLMTESGQSLAGSQLGVAEATKRVAATMSSGGKNLQQSLFGLGYNLDEQGGLIADVMAQMAAAGDPFRASEPELIAATKEHAKNTRLLANYTGEDLKRKEQEAQKYKSYLAFQGKLLEMEPAARQKFQDKFNSLDEQTRKNYMDTVVFGNVINQTGATMMAYNTQYADQQNQLFSMLNDQNVGLKEIEESRAAASQTLAKNLARDPTAAALQILGVEFSQSFGEYNRVIGGRNVEALARAIDHTDKAATAMDGLTRTVANANIDIESFRSRLEQIGLAQAANIVQILNPILNLIEKLTPAAITSFETMTKFILQSAEQLSKILATDPKKLQANAENALTSGVGGAMTGGAIMGGLTLAIGAALAPFTGGASLLGATAGMTAMGAGLGYAGANPLKMFGVGGKASGGPVMPGGTYLVGERGPELLTMGQGGSVTPNSQIASAMDATARTSTAFQDQFSALMREQLAINREMLAETREARGYMMDIRSYQQTLVAHST